MNGHRAKRIRKLAEEFEPRKFKHGQRLYYRNQETGQIMAGGYRAASQTFKRQFKKLRREDYVQEVIKADQASVL